VTAAGVKAYTLHASVSGFFCTAMAHHWIFSAFHKDYTVQVFTIRTIVEL
jgi:hypothetical protein